MSELITNAVKRTPWLRRLSAPVRVLVEERIRQDGYADDPDGWIADLLTAARRSPQGYVLRISASKSQAAALMKAAVEDTDLFGASGGGEPMPPELKNPTTL